MERFTGIEQDPTERARFEINNVFAKEGISLSPDYQSELDHQIDTKRRYICVVGERRSENGDEDVFFKAPFPGAKENLERFKRSVYMGSYLKENSQIQTRGIISTNLDESTELPYAVMETFKKDEAKIGFLSGFEDAELLTEIEAQSCVEELKKFQEVDVENIPSEVREILAKYKGDSEEFCADIMKRLSRTVKSLDTEGEGEPLYEVLSRRLGVNNFRELSEQLIDKYREILASTYQKRTVLVHGDLAPNNLYVHDNGQVEFLDLEYLGTCDNEIVAAIIDYGNLRARAWNNEEFKNKLDSEIIERYRAEGREEVGKTIVAIGILRSHMNLSGYFENDPPELQLQEVQTRRREATEADISKAWQVAELDFR